MAVALSGGRDSTALLHATLRAAAPLGLQVLALHVHHGLQAEADTWVRHLQLQCARWRRAGWPLRLRVHHVAGRPAAGESIEAWARQARHHALSMMAREEGASLLLLAQHRRDQAETVLLQALRGAGAAGLSAMPRLARREGVVWARPWLEQASQAIDSYVQRHRLHHIEDPSNLDTRFDRNRLRHAVWPALLAAFPAAEQSLQAVARQAQRQTALAAELAAELLQVCGTPGGGLSRSAWLALSGARRWLVLQHWLTRHLPTGASERLLQRLLDEWPRVQQGRWPVEGGGHELRHYRGELRCVALPQPSTDAAAHGRWPPRAEGLWLLGDGLGQVQVQRVEEGGLPWAALLEGQWRPRVGGERFALQATALPRSLKKQWQARGVPAWAREGPLLWRGAQLLWVPGLGTDARAGAAAGTPQFQLHWLA